MAFEEDSKKPDADDANKRRNRNAPTGKDGFQDKAKLSREIGFMLNGVDIRKVDVSELGALLEVEESSDTEHEVLPYPPLPPTKGGRRTTAKEKTPKVPDWVNKVAFPPEELFDPQSYSFGMSKRCFRISSDNMLYYVQMRFNDGYKGVVTLSQTMMFALLSAKNEALRAGKKEIGSEHILLALLQQHAFAAGQLLTSLHLNNIGKPRSIGNCYNLARRSASGFDDDTAFGGSVIFPVRTANGADTYFTNEAEQVLIDSMYIAAKAGLSQTHSKHLLSALIETRSAPVQRAFEALSITEKQVRAALTECPEQDRIGDFVVYFMTAVLNAIFRFRIFNGSVAKYAKFAKPKKSS